MAENTGLNYTTPESTGGDQFEIINPENCCLLAVESDKAKYIKFNSLATASDYLKKSNIVGTDTTDKTAPYSKDKVDAEIKSVKIDSDKSSFGLDGSNLKLSLKDSSGNTIFEPDGISMQDCINDGSGLTYSGNTINHSNSTTPKSIGSSTIIPTINYDAQGHVTSSSDNTVYPPTSSGTSGQYWSSKGSGVGQWTTTGDVAGGDSALVTGGKVYSYLQKPVFSASVQGTISEDVEGLIGEILIPAAGIYIISMQFQSNLSNGNIEFGGRMAYGGLGGIDTLITNSVKCNSGRGGGTSDTLVREFTGGRYLQAVVRWWRISDANIPASVPFTVMITAYKLN